MVYHANVNHISTISRYSPYLFFSLFLLIYNIVFTLTGVSPFDGSKIVLYSAFLAIFFGVCVTIMACKYSYIKHITKIPLSKLAGTFFFDLAFIAMGTLYLAGDNLPIFICSGMRDATDKEDCIEQSSVILGFSLLLHTALYVAGALKLKPTDIPAFPITGRIRKAYQSILQLVAFTIFLDQTFSTVVRFITNVDIEVDETSTCGCVGNATATNCLSLVNKEVGGFLGGLSAIILLIVVGLLVKNWKDYCSCCTCHCSCCACHCSCCAHHYNCCSCRIERNSNHNSYQDIDADRNEGEENLKCIMPHLYENTCIIVVYFLVIAFMGVYTLADNRWLWKCVAVPDPTAGRISMLAIALVFSLGWLVMYVWIICLPGVGIVLGNKRFFSEYEYVTFEASRDNSEWAHKRIRAYVPADPPRELTESSTSITIEEGHGSASISLPIEDETTLDSAYKHIDKILTRCRGTDQSNGGTTRWGWLKCKICWGWLKCKICWGWMKCKIFCGWLKCKICCGWLKCKKCKCDERSASEDKEMIMFAYLGKKENVTTAMFEYMASTMQNVSTVKLSADKGTLDISEVAQRYPTITQFYVVPKPNEDPSRRKTTTTNEPEDGDRRQPKLEASGGFQIQFSERAGKSGSEHVPMIKPRRPAPYRPESVHSEVETKQ